MVQYMPVGPIWYYSATQHLSVLSHPGEGSSDIMEIISIHTGQSEVRFKHAYF